MKGLFQKGFGVVILIVVVAAVTIVGYSFKTGSSPVEVAKQVPRIIGGWIGVGTSLPGQVTSLAQKSVAPLGRTTFGKTTRMKVPLTEKLTPGGIGFGELPFYAVTIAVSLALAAIPLRWVWRKYFESQWRSARQSVEGLVGTDPAVLLIRLTGIASLLVSFFTTRVKQDLGDAMTVVILSTIGVALLLLGWRLVGSLFSTTGRNLLLIVVVIGLVAVFASSLPKALGSPYGVMSAQSWGRWAPFVSLAFAATGGFKVEGILAMVGAFLLWLAPSIPDIFERGPRVT